MSAIDTGQESDHFVESGHLECRNRTGALQPRRQGSAGIEHLQPNIVCVGPSLQRG